MSRRYWIPCRVCGNAHQNPRSSSICPPCGQVEREANARARDEYIRQQAEIDQRIHESSFNEFMNLSEEDRWRKVFDFMENQNE